MLIYTGRYMHMLATMTTATNAQDEDRQCDQLAALVRQLLVVYVLLLQVVAYRILGGKLDDLAHDLFLARLW